MAALHPLRRGRIGGMALSAGVLLVSPLTTTPVQAEATVVTLKLRNGDTIKGQRVADESNDDVIVLIHPDLGRLVIQTSALKPPSTNPWSASIAAGVNGSNTDNDLSAGGSVTVSAKYKRDRDLVTLKGQAQYAISRDDGDANKSVDTNEGSAEVRYSRTLGQRWSAYTSGTFNYDALKSIGTDNLVGSVGLGVDVIKTSTTVVNLSAGPAFQHIWGGNGCLSDPTCGKTYAASSARAALEWTPNKTFKLSLTNQFTGSFVNGLSPSNILTGSLKIFPTSNKSFFMALNGQTIFNTLQTPRINNTVSFQIGAELK